MPTKGVLRWRGDKAARKAVYANPARLKSGIGRKAMRKRGEMVGCSFAHVLDRGGMAAHGCAGVKTSTNAICHVAGFNLSIVMRALFGYGTPKEAVSGSQRIY